jgi:hypothetical protein
MRGEVPGHSSERLLWFPRHVWIGCARFSAAKAFDQASADYIEVVSGIAIMLVNREDKGKHKGAVNACTIEQRRRYAVRWNRLLADRFFTALSEALEDVYATIRQGRIGQGS